MLFTIKSILISNIVHLPFESRQASTLFERWKKLIKEKVRNCLAQLLLFPLHQLSQGIDCWGDTHLIPTDDLCGEGKGANPLSSLPICLGEKGFLGWKLTFSSRLFMRLRFTPSGSNLPFICRLWRQSARLKLAQPPSLSSSLSLCCSFCLPELMTTYMSCGWVLRWLHLPISRATPSTGPGSQKQLREVIKWACECSKDLGDKFSNQHTMEAWESTLSHCFQVQSCIRASSTEKLFSCRRSKDHRCTICLKK